MQRAAIPTTAEPSPQPFAILIVDDEPDYLELLGSTLLNSNPEYKVLNAINGMVALQVANRHQPDLVITDWEMPHMNGLELIAQLRTLPHTADIPIIMATGHQQETLHLKQALDTGATDFLRKPVEAVELVARVQSALRMLWLKRALLAEQQQLLVERAAALEHLSLQIHRKNRLIQHLKKKSEEMRENLNGTLMPQINQLLRLVNDDLQLKDDLSTYEAQMGHLYPAFWAELNKRYPQLSRKERHLCVHLYNGRSTNDIATMLKVSNSAVEMARYRLRKRLGLAPEHDIVAFLQSLG